MVNLSHVIEKIMKIKGVSKDNEIAKALGISPQDFSNRKKRGTLLPVIVEWGLREKINLDFLLSEPVEGVQIANGNGILQGHHIHAEEIHIDVHPPGCVGEDHLYYRRQEDHDQELSEIIHLLKCDMPDEKTKVLKYLRARKDLADAMKTMGDLKDLPE